MGAHAIGRMNLFIVKALQVYGVRAIDCHPPVVDEPPDRIDYAEILVLVVATERSGKKDQRQTMSAPEDKHLKLAAQVWRPPADVTFLHLSPTGLTGLSVL